MNIVFSPAFAILCMLLPASVCLLIHDFRDRSKQADTECESDQNRERSCHDPGEENCGYAELDCFGIRLSEGKAYRNEVRADLSVNGEQSGESILGGDGADGKLRSKQSTDNLCDDSAGAQDRGEDRQRADKGDHQHARKGAAQRRDRIGRYPV